ncbi:hypothetical protein ABH931_000337 [Streptacidiphilus sp. MAP12-33]|uniref:hypothetical protein n=1 Tax=Streptacidiphilus sp. MAP12-33 TaxID=3156266 RepID=UPI00351460DD
MAQPVTRPDRKGGTAVGIGAAGLAATLLVLLFVWIVGASMSSPQPHDIPVGVVGPAPVAQQVVHGIDAAQPGAFDPRVYADADTARAALARQDVLGVVVLGQGQDQVLVTGASGDADKQAVLTLGQQLAAHQSAQLQVVDTAPLPHGDEHGLLAFTLMVGLSLAGLVFQAMLWLRFRGLGRVVWLGSAVAFSLVAGVVAASVADLGLGAFGGHLWEVAAIGALLAFATVSTVALLLRVLGFPAFPIATLLLIQLGIATSGGPLPRQFLPSFYRAVSPGMPGSAEVLAVRRVAYLPNAPIGTELTVLALWAGAGALLTLALWTLRTARPTPPAPPESPAPAPTPDIPVQTGA